MIAIEGSGFDNILHILTALLASALFLLSAVAYKRQRKERFLYICAAFFLFAVREAITTFAILELPSSTLIGVSHLITFIILILFFIGVMK